METINLNLPSRSRHNSDDRPQTSDRYKYCPHFASAFLERAQTILFVFFGPTQKQLQNQDRIEFYITSSSLMGRIHAYKHYPSFEIKNSQDFKTFFKMASWLSNANNRTLLKENIKLLEEYRGNSAQEDIHNKIKNIFSRETIVEPEHLPFFVLTGVGQQRPISQFFNSHYDEKFFKNCFKMVDFDKKIAILKLYNEIFINKQTQCTHLNVDSNISLEVFVNALFYSIDVSEQEKFWNLDNNVRWPLFRCYYSDSYLSARKRCEILKVGIKVFSDPDIKKYIPSNIELNFIAKFLHEGISENVNTYTLEIFFRETLSFFSTQTNLVLNFFFRIPNLEEQIALVKFCTFTKGYNIQTLEKFIEYTRTFLSLIPKERRSNVYILKESVFIHLFIEVNYKAEEAFNIITYFRQQNADPLLGHINSLPPYSSIPDMKGFSHEEWETVYKILHWLNVILTWNKYKNTKMYSLLYKASQRESFCIDLLSSKDYDLFFLKKDHNPHLAKLFLSLTTLLLIKKNLSFFNMIIKLAIEKPILYRTLVSCSKKEEDNFLDFLSFLEGFETFNFFKKTIECLELLSDEDWSFLFQTFFPTLSRASDEEKKRKHYFIERAIHLLGQLKPEEKEYFRTRSYEDIQALLTWYAKDKEAIDAISILCHTKEEKKDEEEKNKWETIKMMAQRQKIDPVLQEEKIYNFSPSSLKNLAFNASLWEKMKNKSFATDELPENFQNTIEYILN